MEEGTGVRSSETSNPASAAAPIPCTKLSYKARLIKWMRGHPAAVAGMMLAMLFGLSLREIAVLVLTHPDPAAPTIAAQPAVKVSGRANPWFRDADGDGFGDPYVFHFTLSPGPGYVSNGYDCNDRNSMVHPGAPELRDSRDNDCDGIIDAARTSGNGNVWRLDTDGDGSSSIAHSPDPEFEFGPGYVFIGGDCNDGNPAIHPGAVEILGNGQDENCDFSDDLTGIRGSPYF